jgi:hypothetical protein
MTKYFLLYIEWTKILWKKELIFEVEANLSVCTVKWVEVEKQKEEEGVEKEEKEKEGKEEKWN